MSQGTRAISTYDRRVHVYILVDTEQKNRGESPLPSVTLK